MKKGIKRLIIILSIFVILSGSLFTIYSLVFNPYRGTIKLFAQSTQLDASITKKQAEEELKFIIDRLKDRHPACMNGLPAATLEAYETQLALLGGDVTALELWQAEGKILTTLSDGHTSLFYFGDSTSLPIDFSYDDSRLFATINGNYCEVLSIDGISTQDLYDLYLSSASYDDVLFAGHDFAYTIRQKSSLSFLGAQPGDAVTIEYLLSGEENSIEIPFQTGDESQQTASDKIADYEVFEDKSLAILRLYQCVNNESYRNTLKSMFSDIKELGIQNVAVDLRENGGGNSTVLNEFLRYINIDSYFVTGGMDVRYGPYLWQSRPNKIENQKIDDLLFSGKVYALTSPKTFSSAVMFVTALQDNGIGEIIGSIPGGKSAHYGDILRFQLPYTKLIFTVSHKYFFRPDSSRGETLTPDYVTEPADAEDKLYELTSNK